MGKKTLILTIILSCLSLIAFAWSESILTKAISTEQAEGISGLVNKAMPLFLIITAVILVLAITLIIICIVSSKKAKANGDKVRGYQTFIALIPTILLIFNIYLIVQNI